MNRLRAARHPMSLWTPLSYLIGPMLVIAAIFSGLASMPRSNNESQKHASRDIKDTLLGVEFDPFGPQPCECYFHVEDKAVNLLRFDHDVIDVDLDYSADVTIEHVVHSSLVCEAIIPQTEGHGSVAIHAIRVGERSHELVGLFHHDLVIVGVGFKEGHGFASRCRIIDLVNPRQRIGNFWTCFI
jgi:hypothetical protein